VHRILIVCGVTRGKNGEALEKIWKALEKYLHRHREKVRKLDFLS
jgi:hypothetical protein